MSTENSASDMTGPHDVDLCVVGSGPAGLAVAGRAADAGRRVLLVEAGRDAPATRGTGVVAPTSEAAAAAEELRAGPPLHAADHLARWRARNLGGSAILWTVRRHRGGQPHLRLARPDDDEIAADDGGQWPDRGQLAAAMDDAAAWFGVGNASFGPVRAEGALPVDHALLEARRLLFAPARTVLEERAREVVGHEGVTVLTGRQLRSLSTTGGRVDRLHLVGDDGSATTVRARDVVLATGAVENARQLLLARDADQVPDPHDLVGRWFGDHPHARVAMIVPDQPIATFGPFHDFHEHGGVLAMGHYVATAHTRATCDVPPFSVSLVGSDAVVTRPAGRAAAALHNRGLRAQPASQLPRRLGTVLTSPVDAARVARRRFGTVPHHHTALGGWSDPATAIGRVDSLTVEAMLPMTMSPDVRVVLDDHKSRPARLQWAWVSRDVDAYWRVVRTVAEQLRAADVGRVLDAGELGSGHVPAARTGYHHIGGTRMAASADAGVVDLDGRHHWVENLWLAGSSVFPSTAGWANPTLLLVGLSLRLGDRLGSR